MCQISVVLRCCDFSLLRWQPRSIYMCTSIHAVISCSWKILISDIKEDGNRGCCILVGLAGNLLKYTTWSVFGSIYLCISHFIYTLLSCLLSCLRAYVMTSLRRCVHYDGQRFVDRRISFLYSVSYRPGQVGHPANHKSTGPACEISEGSAAA